MNAHRSGCQNSLKYKPLSALEVNVQDENWIRYCLARWICWNVLSLRLRIWSVFCCNLLRFIIHFKWCYHSYVRFVWMRKRFVGFRSLTIHEYWDESSIKIQCIKRYIMINPHIFIFTRSMKYIAPCSISKENAIRSKHFITYAAWHLTMLWCLLEWWFSSHILISHLNGNKNFNM